ncbi:exonuclease domain-containing protein [Persicobacter psychrovividus]|uniref:DNA polymerase III subunit epsilon n=1 Tax=Persicobacter psychrovividus TaxID=387638 RepID=A0ABM7VL35_9BACT|nr:DNA polymerase III subunit epsilon [Persicobacter psychrovividus]
MRFLAIDFETANSSRNSACSVGVALFEEGKLIQSGHYYIKPEPNYFAPINIGVHGIYLEMVEHALDFKSIWEEIMVDYAAEIMVCHNAGFDMSVIRSSFDALGLPYPQVNYACTLQLAKKLHPQLPHHKLNLLCQCYDIPLNHHNAESDAVACGLLMTHFMHHFSTQSPEDLYLQLDGSMGTLHSNAYERPYIGYAPQIPLLYQSPTEKKAKEESPLTGKRVAFTGSLNNFSRSEAQKLTEQVGGIAFPANVSRYTHYLVSNNPQSRSTKIQKAQQLQSQCHPIQIIDEETFTQYVLEECD